MMGVLWFGEFYCFPGRPFLSGLPFGNAEARLTVSEGLSAEKTGQGKTRIHTEPLPPTDETANDQICIFLSLPVPQF